MNTKELFKNYIFPVATVSGGIIGVGFFSLPYIAMKVGIFTMLFYFIVLTALVVLIHLIFAQISLKTPDYKRFPGFVGFYLGKWPKALSLTSMILGSFGVLLVYLIIGSQFLTNILHPIFGGSNLIYTLVYFAVAGTVIYFGIKTVSKAELIALILLFISLFLIFIKGFSHIHFGNLFVSNPNFKASDLFLPYGALLFSLWGIGLIPEVEEMLVGRKDLLKKVIVISTVISSLVFLFFTFLVLGISGGKTTESALIGLKSILGSGIANIFLFAGVVTTFTAFIALSLTLKKVFIYDLKIKETHAWIYTCLPPMILFLMGFNSFITLISFVGGILLGIDGILILLMYKKIGGKKWLIYPLSFVFLLGIVYEIVYFLKLF